MQQRKSTWMRMRRKKNVLPTPFHPVYLVSLNKIWLELRRRRRRKKLQSVLRFINVLQWYFSNWERTQQSLTLGIFSYFFFLHQIEHLGYISEWHMVNLIKLLQKKIKFKSEADVFIERCRILFPLQIRIHSFAKCYASESFKYIKWEFILVHFFFVLLPHQTEKESALNFGWSAVSSSNQS